MSTNGLLARGILFGGATLALAGWAASWTVVCRQGVAQGQWDLQDSATPGHAVGELIEGSSTLPIYAFDAQLTDMPTPCLSCIAGRVNGVLDDGVGPGPDYVIRGEYSGAFLSGSGSFACNVFLPGSDIRVGRIEGRFRDSPANSAPGRFRARWRICP